MIHCGKLKHVACPLDFWGSGRSIMCLHPLELSSSSNPWDSSAQTTDWVEASWIRTHSKKLAMEVAKTFDLSNTLPHLKGNHKAFQSHAVTMFKNSSSSLDTQTIPLKPLPCPARWTLHLAIIFATYAASPRQVHGNGRNPCIETPFFSAAGNPHLARVCKKPRALNLSNFYVGTWSPNNDFGATLKLKVGARYFPDFCHQRI